MKQLTIILIVGSFLMSACKSTVDTYELDQEITLLDGHGLVALGTNSLDYI